MKNKPPHFIIKNNFQRRKDHYSDILPVEILRDICIRATGQSIFTHEFVGGEYNKGRLVILEYSGKKIYISLSETGEIKARNSSLQSFPTALIQFYRDTSANKEICFYFLPIEGNIETDYFRFMYRLMFTLGVKFINKDILKKEILPFVSVDDLIAARNSNKNKNKSNNSTYLTRDSGSTTQIYCKTYGANKKEAVLLSLALSKLTNNIELYEICEKNLKELPKPDLEVIRSLGNIKIITTDITLEKKEFDKGNSLRSPLFIYNLLEKLGPKKCAFCGCEIPELIQGAHIWPVQKIKNTTMNINKKILCATDGNNGMWLCENHHAMLDEALIEINPEGKVIIRNTLNDKAKTFISQITTCNRLPQTYLTDGFYSYLKLRYK